MVWDKKWERLDHGTDRDTPLRGVPVVPCPTGSGPSHVTNHAILRYQERVESIPMEAVKARLSTTGIRAAIAFGVRIIRLGCGAQLIIEEGRIVTVLAAHQRPKRVGPSRIKHWRRKQPRKHWDRKEDAIDG